MKDFYNWLNGVKTTSVTDSVTESEEITMYLVEPSQMTALIEVVREAHNSGSIHGSCEEDVFFDQ